MRLQLDDHLHLLGYQLARIWSESGHKDAIILYEKEEEFDVLLQLSLEHGAFTVNDSL